MSEKIDIEDNDESQKAASNIQAAFRGKKDGATTTGEAKQPSGKRVSQVLKATGNDLKDFVAVFEPYAEDSDAGKALRQKGFFLADPNGNGLCSLAELEGFILKVLLPRYPKDATGGSERGKDLFDAFRPCYIRAFADAKDYKADTGKVIEGTKNATSDDFVSKGEFKYFCAYVIIYATMFDAFAQIDGGGAGRDANDDKRIEKSEWIAGYKGVTHHGFVAFAGLNDDFDANAVFDSMDDNKGGIVLLDEFCAYIKLKEIEAKTETGALLGANEAGGVGKVGKLKDKGEAKVTSAKGPASPSKAKKSSPATPAGVGGGAAKKAPPKRPSASAPRASNVPASRAAGGALAKKAPVRGSSVSRASPAKSPAKSGAPPARKTSIKKPALSPEEQKKADKENAKKEKQKAQEAKKKEKEKAKAKKTKEREAEKKKKQRAKDLVAKEKAKALHGKGTKF